jgi:hypothetical protein
MCNSVTEFNHAHLSHCTDSVAEFWQGIFEYKVSGSFSRFQSYKQNKKYKITKISVLILPILF